MQEQDLFGRLQSCYNDLTSGQKKIAQYVFSHYDYIVYMSAQEFAKAAGVSDATVIRFARSIGFDGYSSFKQALKQAASANQSPDERVKRTLSSYKDNDLPQQIIQTDIANLQKWSDEINFVALTKAAKLIYTAKTIFLAGKGTSSIVVQFLELHLRRMGFPVCSINESITVSHEKLIGMSERDVLLVCGFPRYSKDTYNIVRYAKAKQAKTIVITDNALSPLTEKGDVLLTAKVENATFFHSYIVPMELCNLLLMEVLHQGGEAIYERMKNNIRGLKIFDMTL